MAKKKQTKKSTTEKISPPQMTILSDLAVEDSNRSHHETDQLQLGQRLGPTFDILRHKNTDTPMAVAISGDWGSGKTSAMRWLQSRLETWSKQNNRDDHPAIRTVWFDPWKYHKRDDVWRGLIAEVILHCFDIKNLKGENAVKRVTSAVRKFGSLGRGFLNALENITANLDLAGVEVEIKGKLFRDINDEYQKAAHPERIYLNEFEETLKSWIYDFIHEKKERLIIFIDDLDRCLPEVTLEVFEALKLYLAIPNLIFVLGVDRDVVDAVVKKHYSEQGVDEIKSASYLNKMFQVELSIAPSQKHVEGFLDYQIAELNRRTRPDGDENETHGYWARMFPDEEDEAKNRKITIEEAIRKLCEHNPREVKRLLNGVVLWGDAATRSVEPDDVNFKLRFAQGGQVFLVWQILQYWFFADRKVANMLRDENGQDFFKQWSEITRENPDVNPPAFKGAPDESDSSEKRTRPLIEMTEQSEEETDADDKEARRLYGDFIIRWVMIFGRKAVKDLLGHRVLRNLMMIPFDGDVAGQTAATPKQRDTIIASEKGSEKKTPAGAMPDVIREATARELEKRPEELSPLDYTSLQKLDLVGSSITDGDMFALSGLTSLQELKLGETSVSDISALSGLTSLQTLHLESTQVKDINALSGLTSLQDLRLHLTQVKDINALSGLTSIQVLTFSGTQVSNISDLSGLTRLEILHASGTQVSDISALSGLNGLQYIWLNDTQVSDISSLSGLINLQSLELKNTQVSEKQKKELRKKIPGLKIHD